MDRRRRRALDRVTIDQVKMLPSVFRNALNTSIRRRAMINAKPCISSHRFFSSEDATKEEEPVVKMSNDHAMDPHVQAVFDSIIKLNMIEIAELSEALQKKFNLPDQNMVMTSGGGAGDAGGAEEAKEEKTAFDVKLSSFDAKGKIKIIKEVRAITGLGLKEAKTLVESVPAVLKKDLKKEEADALAEKLKELGGVVELE